MAIEETLASIDKTLKELLTVAQSGAQATAEIGKPDTRKPGRPRKDASTEEAEPEKKSGETPAHTPSEAAAPSTAPAQTPAADTPAASTASTDASAVTYQQVAEAMSRLNKGTLPTQGRNGVIAILTKYLPDTEQRRVPMLEPLGKNAEILKDIEALLVARAEDDLGI